MDSIGVHHTPAEQGRRFCNVRSRGNTAEGRTIFTMPVVSSSGSHSVRCGRLAQVDAIPRLTLKLFAGAATRRGPEVIRKPINFGGTTALTAPVGSGAESKACDVTQRILSQKGEG